MCSRVDKNDQAGWEQKKGRKNQVRQEPRRESSKIKVETGQSSKPTKKNAAKRRNHMLKLKPGQMCTHLRFVILLY